MKDTLDAMNPAGFFVGATELLEKVTETGKALQRAETQAKNNIVDIDGTKYYWDESRGVYREIKASVPDDEPMADPLLIFTLDGLIEYVKENVEGLIPPRKDGGERLILHVRNERTVVLLGKPSKHHKKRPDIAGCKANVPEITFGRYMDTETFNTMLLSMFIETQARADLFKVIKSMTKEQNLNTTDDGVSQVITVKQGVSLASNVQFQNPVPLKPMRTFTEIEQPESNFTLRVNEDAQAALFEADGGAWKNEAVKKIKDYLNRNLYGHNVVIIA